MNPIDALVNYVNPKAGLERYQARQKMSMTQAFNATKRDRPSLKDWLYKRTNDVNTDIDKELVPLREMARDLERNAPLAHAAFNVLNAAVIGPGLRVRPQVDGQYLGLSKAIADRKQLEIRRIFETWAESPDADRVGLSSFYDLQSELFHSHLLNGDAFCLINFRESKKRAFYTQLQTIEADRVKNPGLSVDVENMCAGFELSAAGVPRAIHIAKNSASINGSDFQRVPLKYQNGRAQVLIHRHHVKRSGQLRGISLLHPVIEALKKVDTYMQAELAASAVASHFTVFIKNLNAASQGIVSEGATETFSADSELQLKQGGCVQLDPDQEVELANPSRPSVAFEPFVLSMWRQLGAALGIPYEILIMNFNASYSASKASLLEFAKRVIVHRIRFVRSICQPVYEQVLFEAVLRNFIDLPGFLDNPMARRAWCQCFWYGPIQGDIDEVKAAKAAQIRLENGLSSKAMEAEKLWNRDFDQIEQERKLEKRQEESLID